MKTSNSIKDLDNYLSYYIALETTNNSIISFKFSELDIK